MSIRLATRCLNIHLDKVEIKYLVLQAIAHNASSLGSDIHHNLKQGRFDAVFRLCRTLEEYEIQAGFIAKGDNERAEKFIKQRDINELKKLAVFFPTKPKSWHLPKKDLLSVIKFLDLDLEQMENEYNDLKGNDRNRSSEYAWAKKGVSTLAQLKELYRTEWIEYLEKNGSSEEIKKSFKRDCYLIDYLNRICSDLIHGNALASLSLKFSMYPLASLTSERQGNLSHFVGILPATYLYRISHILACAIGIPDNSIFSPRYLFLIYCNIKEEFVKGMKKRCAANQKHLSPRKDIEGGTDIKINERNIMEWFEFEQQLETIWKTK